MNSISSRAKTGGRAVEMAYCGLCTDSELASGLRLPSDDISIARGSGPERARRACIRGPVIDLIDEEYCGTEHLLAKW